VGTEINLKLGAVTLDWSKNSRGADHGALFQETDRAHLHSDQTDYEYCAEHGIPTEVDERSFVRSLRATIPRLELLGYTIAAVEAEYEACIADWQGYQDEADNRDGAAAPSPLSFSEFIEFLARHPINMLDTSYMSDFEPEDFVKTRRRFETDPAYSRIPNPWGGNGNSYSEVDYFGSLVGMLHPYSTMRLLALVQENIDLDIVWHYGPMVDSGWAKAEEFTPCARRDQTLLIATEGSSDVYILKHAITLLMPEVADFFRFIDVSERHPFSGTGSLVKFAEGLVKIDVQNRILFLFDNDAEGWSAFDEVRKYKLPSNMSTMVLPELDEFRQFEVWGPQGATKGDINRRAAAIECYLDLRLDSRPPAKIIWTNYKKDRNDYQGSLEYKETYMKAFLDETQETLATEKYDVSKLRLILERIFHECSGIAGQLKARYVSS
jgi:hypothetical protein